MAIFSGSFLSPTATGNFSVTSLDFAPNIVFFHGAESVDPEGVTAGAANLMYGCAAMQSDDTLGQIVGAFFKQSTVSPNPKISDSDLLTTKCIYTFSAVNTALLSASMVTLDSSGFTLNFDAVDATARRVYYTAMRLTDAGIKIGTFATTLSAGASTVSVAGLEFTPDLVLFIGADRTDTEHIMWGVDSRAGNRFVMQAGYVNGALDSSAVARNSTFDSRSICHEYSAGGGTGRRLSGKIGEWSETGFRIDLDYSTARTVGYIALGYVDYKVGTDVRGTVGVSHAVTGAGFRPEGMLAGSNNTDFSSTLPSAGSTSSGTKLIFGAADEDLHQYSYGYSRASPAANTYTISREGISTRVIRRDVSTTDAQLISFDADGFTIRWNAGDSAGAEIGYVLLRENPNLAPSKGPQLIENEVELAPKQTHYMVVGHKTAAVAPSGWTIYLFKNGERVTDIEVNVVENPEKIYTFSFQNDGTHDSQWQLVVYETASSGTKYAMAWKVYKKIIEQSVKMMRSRLDSEGGFFSQSNEE